MTLALAAATHAQHYNADFYTVAATVIPVLFLAVAVQGPAYEGLLRYGAERARRSRALWESNDPPDMTGYQFAQKFLTLYGYLMIAAILGFLGAAFIGIAVAGQICALLGLYHKQAGYESFVLQAAIVLTCVAASGPVWHSFQFLAAADEYAEAPPARPPRAPGRGQMPRQARKPKWMHAPRGKKDSRAKAKNTTAMHKGQAQRRGGEQHP